MRRAAEIPDYGAPSPRSMWRMKVPPLTVGPSWGFLEAQIRRCTLADGQCRVIKRSLNVTHISHHSSCDHACYYPWFSFTIRSAGLAFGLGGMYRCTYVHHSCLKKLLNEKKVHCQVGKKGLKKKKKRKERKTCSNSPWLAFSALERP